MDLTASISHNPNVTVEALADTLQVDHRLNSVFSTQGTIDDESVEFEPSLAQTEGTEAPVT